MIDRRCILNGLVAAVFAAALTLSAAVPSKADEVFSEGAKGFITNLAEEAISSLTVTDITRDERRTRFRRMLHDYFAFKGIAKWVLGRYWRRASQPEREEFMTLFEDLMVVTYADRFEKYTGETLSVLKAEVRGGKDALVHSRLIRSGGLKPVDVVWRVRRKDDNFKIVDVMVEGLSMGLTQQKDFASVIRQNGARFKICSTNCANAWTHLPEPAAN